MNNVLPLSMKLAEDREVLKKPETAESALTKALTNFGEWRAHKTKPAEPIPQELWLQIFSLESFYKPMQLRRFFSVSTRQYQTKHDELLAAESKTPLAAEVQVNKATSVATHSLCEIKIKPESPYSVESLPSGKTLVVEFCRSDGKIMKIHTTQDSIPTLIQTFFGEQVRC